MFQVPSAKVRLLFHIEGFLGQIPYNQFVLIKTSSSELKVSIAKIRFILHLNGENHHLTYC